jgi:hypothetical protein
MFNLDYIKLKVILRHIFLTVLLMNCLQALRVINEPTWINYL